MLFTVITFAAVSLCVVLGALACFQAALALGAPLGRFAWGGQHRILPVNLRIGSVVSIVIYALIAMIVLARAGRVSFGIPDGFVNVAIWVVAGYFVLGIAMNLASKSKAERSVMPAVSALLGALCIVIAAS